MKKINIIDGPLENTDTYLLGDEKTGDIITCSHPYSKSIAYEYRVDTNKGLTFIKEVDLNPLDVKTITLDEDNKVVGIE